MAGEDLVLAGVASAILRNAKPTATVPATPGSTPTASFTQSQLEQLSGAIAEGVRSIEIPAPVVNVPPAQLPSNLQINFTPEELAKIAEALKPSQRPTKLIETRVMTADFNGGILTNSTFPQLQRIVSYQFVQDYYMIATTLSCSIVNITTAVSGLFFGRDLGEFVNINQQSDTQTASDIYISQMTHQNSTITTIAPLSRTNTVAFGGDAVFVPVQAGTRLALYACGFPGANGNQYTAVVNLHIIAM